MNRVSEKKVSLFGLYVEREKIFNLTIVVVFTFLWTWNEFLWPLIVTNSPEVRPVTVGLSVFATVERGVEWSLVNAATLMTTAPLIIAFLIFQRQFVANFMRAGIK